MTQSALWNSQQKVFKEISKDTFMKYKKVRKIVSPLMGEYCLYSKDGVKYIVKELEKNKSFLTTRPTGSIVYHKYTSPKTNTSYYIYPLFGCTLESVIRAALLSKTSFNQSSKSSSMQNSVLTDQAKQYANLLSRHNNNPEKLFIHILKFILKYTLPVENISLAGSTNNLINSSKQASSLAIPSLHLECIRVYNGELMYCYDTWMNSQAQIVINNIRQIENLYLSEAELRFIGNLYQQHVRNREEIKQMNKNHEETISFGEKKGNGQKNEQKLLSNKLQTKPSVSFFESISKSFFLVLYLGSLELNLRLYQWGQFKVNYQNLIKRLNYFKLRLNNNNKQKLAHLFEKVLLKNTTPETQLKIQDIWALIDCENKKDQLSSSLCKSQARSSAIKAPTRVTLSKKDKNSSLNDSGRFSVKDSNYNYSSCQSGSKINFVQNQENQFNYCVNKRNDMTNLEDYVLKQSNSQPEFLEELSQQNQVKRQYPLRQGYFSKIPLVSSKIQDPIKIQNYDQAYFLRRQEDLQNMVPSSAHSSKKVNFKKQSANKNTTSNSIVKIHQSNKKPSRKTLQPSLLHPRLSIQQTITNSLCSVNDQSLNCENNIKLLKLLNLQQYLPTSTYESNIIQYLSDVVIKKSFVKKQYQDNSLYLGEILEDKKNQNHEKELAIMSAKKNSFVRNGKGLYIFPSNDIYYGDWVDNYMDGYGIYIFRSGDVYSGELVKGKKQGYGSFVYSTATGNKVYQGFWKNNYKSGLGSVTFCGSKSKHDSNNGQMVKFVGLFKQKIDDNQVQGIFTGYDSQNQKLWSRQGCLMEYNYQKRAFTKNGKGSQLKNKNNKLFNEKILKCSASRYQQKQDNDGNSYKGETLNNRKNGYGVQTSGQQFYQGYFQNNQRNGKGKLTLRQQFCVEGQWKDGFLVSYEFNMNLD